MFEHLRFPVHVAVFCGKDDLADFEDGAAVTVRGISFPLGQRKYKRSVAHTSYLYNNNGLVNLFRYPCIAKKVERPSSRVPSPPPVTTSVL